MKKSNAKNTIVGILVLAVIAGLLGFNTIAGLFTHAPQLSTHDLALTCTTDMATQFHIHPHLTIIINGVNQIIPANTGITADCMHPLHTHDTTGTIHVESPEQRDFILADFFAVWGKTFNKNQILDAVIDSTHHIIMTVNSAPSDAYENLVLKDLDNIVIEYKKIAISH